MERATPFTGGWVLIQAIAWVFTLDGVADYFSYQRYLGLFRQLLFISGGWRDPSIPRVPRDGEGWREWLTT